jgi:hypothetical protein
MIIFIADFFVEHILGGGELNNEECIKLLEKEGCTVQKFQSQLITPAFINQNKTAKFIIANFINLHPACKAALEERDYVIYEHDHKYLKSRNPAVYPDFKAPSSELINLDFYQNAIAVLCQSQFHRDIIERNTGLTNLINLSGNLWPEDVLTIIREIAIRPKQKKYSIINSPILHKNTRDAVLYCETQNLEYELVSNNIYEDFLRALGANEKFIFLPKTPETLSRIAVEAKMMNMSLIINKMLGASREPWFKFKGEELIDAVYEMRKRIPNTIMEVLGCDST